MNSERLKQLLNYLQEDPNDPFTLYAVAMEYLDFDDEKAISMLKKIIESHPTYLPSYYQLARLFQAENQSAKAIEIYKAGINLAKSQNNHQTLKELNNALNELLFEDDSL